jgi:peptide/nickel transport system permease protein
MERISDWAAPEAAPPATGRSLGRRAGRELWRNKAALAGLAIVLAMIACAAAAPWLAPFDPTLQDVIDKRLRPPLWVSDLGERYWLGTDYLGRDILSRIIYGARISLAVGFGAVALAGSLGLAIGLTAGYWGGWFDDLFMRLGDIQLAFPFVLLAIALVAVLGPSLTVLILVLGITGWVNYARVVRAEVLSLREREYVAAVLALGGGTGRVLARHLLPNVLTPAIVMATLEVARMIIIESALSFLGLGVQPPTPAWGSMLADGRQFLVVAWWPATLPGLAIMLTVLGINLIGDWLRDTLDPRLDVG